MGIHYRMVVNAEVLIVSAWGRDDGLESVKRYGNAVVEAALSGECTKVLCDERGLEYGLQDIEAFQYANFIRQIAPPVAQVAIVCDPRGIEDGVFWERAASKGGLQVRVFPDLDEAERWLGTDCGSKWFRR